MGKALYLFVLSHFRTAKRNPLRLKNALTADAKPRDQGLIARLVPRLHIIEELTALRDEFQETPARMIILNMRLEMLGEVRDALAQDRDLHFGRSSIALLQRIFLHQRLFAL